MEGPSREGRPFVVEPARRARHFQCMLVFLDFEASSLGKRSYPIEVGWVFADGRSESWLIRPAPGWTDWDPASEAIHNIPRATLLRDGAQHEQVAHRMIEELDGHDLCASAPSWDGKWLSVLLRTAGLPRHSLTLRDSDDARRECAAAILSGMVPAAQLAETLEQILQVTDERIRNMPPAHRALADAETERARWLAVRVEAERIAATGRPAASGMR